MHHPKAGAGDYDARTALHIAACEGNMPMCMLLAKGPHGKACLSAKDRWGKTAAEEAHREGHVKLGEQLKKVEEDATVHLDSNSMAEENLDGIEEMPLWNMPEALRDNAPRPRVKSNAF